MKTTEILKIVVILTFLIIYFPDEKVSLFNGFMLIICLLDFLSGIGIDSIKFDHRLFEAIVNVLVFFSFYLIIFKNGLKKNISAFVIQVIWLLFFINAYSLKDIGYIVTTSLYLTSVLIFMVCYVKSLKTTTSGNAPSNM